MERSEYDITTFIDHETGDRVGSMDFALPSLREGMVIQMGNGDRAFNIIVRSWSYVFSNAPAHGLVVQVEIVS